MNKSNIEEIIGLLWSILWAILWANDAHAALLWCAGFMAVTCHIGAIYFAIGEARKGRKSEGEA